MKARGDRIVSLARQARQQAQLEQAVHAAITEYLTVVADAVGHTAITAAADEPDVHLGLLDQAAAWPAILHRRVLPALQAMIDQITPPAAAMTRATTNAISAWRAGWLRQRTQALADVPDQITRQIRDAITDDVTTTGPDPRSAARIVRDMLNPDADTWRARAQTIARTEVVSANNQGGLAAYRAVHQSLATTGGQVYKTWLATGGTGSREDHNDVDGTEIPIDETFTVGGEQMTGPGDEAASADQIINCRCVSGATRIESHSVHAASRRWHDGPMIRLQTRRGHELTVTPNHPILTPTGWVEASALHEGQQVVTGSLVERVALVDPDVPEVPPTASELFNAIAFAGVEKRAASAGVDFHGDAVDGDIEVAFADNMLSRVRDSHLVQQSRHVAFSAAHAEVSLSGDQATLHGISHSQDMSGARVALLDAATVQSSNDGRSTEPGRCGDGIDGFARQVSLRDRLIVLARYLLSQLPSFSAAAKDAFSDQEVADRRRCDAVLAREGLNAYAGQVLADDVVTVEVHRFSGHVFNFSSSESAYIADGIVTHNCTLTYRVDDGAGALAADGRADDQPVTAALEAPVTTPTITDTPEAPADGAEVAPASQYPDGTQWAGPLCPVDNPSADGRMLASAGCTVRPLPLPLSFQLESSHGGEESGRTVIVGRILGAQVEDGLLVAYGDFLDPGDNFQVADAIQAAAQRVQSGLGMVSVDTAPTVVEYAAPQPDGTLVPVDPMLYDGDQDAVIMVAAEWELMGATLVADPAFGTARVAAVEGAAVPGGDGAVAAPSMPPSDADPGAFSKGGFDSADAGGPTVTADTVTFPDGTTVSVGDTVTITDALGGDSPETGTVIAINPDERTVTVSVDGEDTPDSMDVSVDNITAGGSDDSAGEPDAVVAASRFAALDLEHVYPAEWFEPVALDAPTGITVTDDGRVYGHLATFGTCHTGFPDACVTAPSSATGYSYFHLGETDTSAGPLAVGKLTVGGGHAHAKLGWQGTVEHYDNAGAAVAVVRAHEDEHGIQVTGGVLPNATPEQVSALRRSPLSGDWRRIGGNLELVAALGVSVPGFPVPRAALAASGQQVSLVAAGVVHAEAGEGEPDTTGGVTLPSGVQLTSVDVSVLASAFDEAANRRTQREQGALALRTRLRDRQAAALRERIHA